MENLILHGSWQALMSTMKPNSVDLILTDPPYGMSYLSNIPGDRTWNKSGESESRFETLIEGDDKKAYAAIKWKRFFQQCERVLRPDSYCVLHCNVQFLGQKWEDIEKSGLKYKGCIAWNKMFCIGGDLKGAAKRDWEPIIYLAKGKPKLNPLMVKRKGKLQERKRISEIEDWAFSLKKSEKRGHPTQKPVALAEQFIQWMTQKGDTVLDPFAGSGTTLLASKLQGRSSLGFEIDEEYVKIADKRLQEC